MNDQSLISWLVEPFQYQFMCRGLVMALLLGVGCALVGSVLLLRRMALAADSFGHALLPGVGLAYLLVGPGLGAAFIGALIAGLFTGVMSTVVNRLSRLPEDAAMAALNVISFAAGVALMSRIAAPTDLLHYLFGNILAITASDLTLVALVTTLTVLLLAVGYRALVLEVFDPIFHRASGGKSLLTHIAILVITVLSLVAALRAVGLVLALGLFILPAVTAYLWCERFGSMLLGAAADGGIASVLGCYLSYQLDLPSGPCMIAVLGLGFIISLLASPRHGVLSRFLRPRHHLDDHGAEDCQQKIPPGV